MGLYSQLDERVEGGSGLWDGSNDLVVGDIAVWKNKGEKSGEDEEKRRDTNKFLRVRKLLKESGRVPVNWLLLRYLRHCFLFGQHFIFSKCQFL